MKFQELRLIEPILRAVAAEGYATPTPIQAQSIPHVLAGKDLLGCAQTGTGKTAAFALPMLQRLMQADAPASAARTGRRRHIRALVLAPTRELAAQIDDSFRTYGRHSGLRSTVIFGGVSQHPQTQALKNGVDILVATPGRLMDLMNQGYVELGGVEIFVLDEADNMLDMGFIHDIRKIIPHLPRQRQTLLFSATMPPEIRQLADALLRQPVSVAVAPVAATVDTVEQSVYLVDKPFKPAMLTHFLNHNAIGRVLVFARTKHGADRLARHLTRTGIRAEAIHGNKSQNARNRVMSQFKSGSPPVLVATDIAARGLDIDDVTHVVNYDLPNVPEVYVHRIGRTARAGASGVAVTFCDHEERGLLRDIERLIRKAIRVRDDQPKFTADDTPKRSPRSEQRHETAVGDRPQHGRNQGGRGQSARNPGGRGQNGRNRNGTQHSGRRRSDNTGGQPAFARTAEVAYGLESADPLTETQAPAVAMLPEAPTGVGYRSRGRRFGRGRRPGGR